MAAKHLILMMALVLALPGCKSTSGNGFPPQLQTLIAQSQLARAQTLQRNAQANTAVGKDLSVNSVAPHSEYRLRFVKGALLPSTAQLSRVKSMADRYPILLVKVGPITGVSVFASMGKAQKRASQLLKALNSSYAKPLVEYSPTLQADVAVVSFEMRPQS